MQVSQPCDQLPLMKICAAPKFGLMLFASLSALAAPSAAVDFVALGDLPYGESADVEARYHALISSINSTRPAFSVHVGDIKSGKTSCADPALIRQRDNFGRFSHPLIYTPGDNEWTDCHRASNGGFSPIERLERIRQLFFRPGQALGQAEAPGVSQAESMPEFGEFVENRRWELDKLLFVTLHVVGSDNGLQSPAPEAGTEFRRRDLADRAWLQAAFARAAEMGAEAVVLFMQADPFGAGGATEGLPEGAGLRGIFSETLLPLARDWGRPVLLVHGDEHRLRSDQPFRLDRATLANVWRLGVPGADDMRALHIHWHGAPKAPFDVKVLAP